ncbi:MAG TPA: DUF1700 domain-containing protein [Lachnospiraceae bacterium]|nr:DUF1700 domain-containing protein [Lachnospiraceae bacterium]
MKKQEFLDGLRTALSTRVGAGTVSENVNYYENYINTQIRMGKSEDEVVASLGDPSLLARSIAEANKHAGVSGSQGEYDNGGGYQSRNNQQSYQNNGTYKANKFKMPVWLIIFIVIFVILIVFSLIFSVLSFLAPILLPVILVILLIRVIRRT